MTTKEYIISAKHKKATYQTEKWTNKLESGKKVIFLVTTFFRWGNFTIELTEKEKEDILKREDIVLNDYNVSCDEIWDSCDIYTEIQDKDKYTKEELNEIHELLNIDGNDDGYSSDTQYDFDPELFENNDWDIDDTIYGISCECDLEPIS